MQLLGDGYEHRLTQLEEQLTLRLSDFLLVRGSDETTRITRLLVCAGSSSRSETMAFRTFEFVFDLEVGNGSLFLSWYD